MLSVKEVALVYATLLSSPGMLDPVKVNLQLSRKQVLFLCKVIEQGLSVDATGIDGSILQIMEKSDRDHLQQVTADLLGKGGLAEMHDKLTSFQTKS